MTVFNDDFIADENDTVAGNVFNDNGNGTDIDDGGNPGQTVVSFFYNGITYLAGETVDLGGGGSLLVEAGGTFFFVPGTAFDYLPQGDATSFSFTYTNDDNETATVTIDINGVNDAPVAVDVVDSVTEDDGALVGTVVATDADDGAVLTYALVGPAPAGLTFSPSGGYLLDSTHAAYNHLALGATEDVVVSYNVTDELGAVSTTQTLTITITGTNDAPVAPPLTGSFSEDAGSGVTLDLLFNATDVDDSADLDVANVDVSSDNIGRVVAFSLDEETGILTLDSNQFTDLAVGENEIITVTYDVVDGEGGVTPTTATFTVTGANDAPVAVDASAEVNEDATIMGSVSASDVDDGAVLTYALTGEAPVGLTFNSDGSYSFDASSYDSLADGATQVFAIGFVANDGTVDSAPQTLTITVAGTNDVPVASVATGTTTEGRAVSGSLPAASDVDTGSSIASYQLTAAAPAGFVLNPNGTWSFTGQGFDALAQGQTGTLVVNYPATDNDGGVSAPQTLTITVTGIAGTSGNDTIYGTAGDDILEGGAGTDNIYGGAGNDTFIGNVDGVGDSYRGEGGIDTVDYSGATSAMNINLNNAASGGGVGTDQLYSIENAIGSAYNDTISGSSVDNRITGGLGNDTINGNGGIDTVVINANATSGMAVQGSFNLTVTSADGVDVLRNVEFIQFNNALVRVNGVTGNAYAYGVADTNSASEDGAAATGNVLTNDIEIEGEAMSVSGSGVFVGAHGTLTINANGTYSYVATDQSLADGEVVSDVFSYTVIDTAGEGSTASLTFTVTGTNDGPVASAGSNNAAEDGMISGSVVATDVDGDTLSYSLDDEAPAGLIFNSDGSYSFDASSYELNEGETQDVTFSFTASDGNGGTSSASYTITVTGINDAPVAYDSSDTVDEDGTINGAVSATDIDGTVESYQLVGEAPEGLTFNTDGTYSFDADSYDALGQGDTLEVTATFTATDDQGQVSAPRTLTITITGENDAPVVSGDDFEVDEDGSYEGSVSGSDVDGMVVSYALTDEAPEGLTFNTDGTYSFDASSYELNEGESDTISFTFTGTDDSGGVSDPRTVTITINGINDLPVANASTDEVDEDSTVNGAVSASDVDGTVVSYQLVGEAPDGLTFNTDGTYNFDAASYDFVAEGDTLDVVISFTATDDQGAVSAPQTLTITITGSNDAPTVSQADFSVDEDASVSGSVSGSDVDGTVVSYTLVGEAPTGLTFNTDGTYTFDASSYDSLNAGDDTTVQFTFFGTDDSGGVSDPRTVTVTVNGQNDAPVANASAEDVEEDSAFNGSVSASDEDGTVVSYQLVGEAPEGLVFNTDGTYSFDAESYDYLAEGEEFDVIVSFTATDDQGIVSAPQTLTITVTGSNDAPTVSLADFSVDEDTIVSGTVSGADVDGEVVSYTLVGDAPEGLTFNTDGSYSFDASSYDSLGTGQTQEVSFTFTGTDDSGGVSDPETVTITVFGTNDAPTASVATNSVLEDATVAGSVSASDVDSTVASYQLVGEVPTGLTFNADGTYSFDAGSYDSLAAGETLDVTATFTATDDEGTVSDSQTLTITITGTNDAPTATASSGGVTEDVNVTPSSMGGVFAEVEPNTSLATANVLSRDAFRISANADLGDDGLPSLSVTANMEGNNDVGAGSYDWFAITLEAGETLYVDIDHVNNTNDVHVALYNGSGGFLSSNGHAGPDAGNGTGSHGYLTFTAVSAGTYYIQTDHYLYGGDSSYVMNLSIGNFVGVVGTDSATSTLNDSGTVDFGDVDLSDSHTVDAAADGMGYLGTFAVELGDDSTGSGSGGVTWTFSVDNDAVQFLAAGQVLTQTYTVTIDDGEGGTVDQTVTITITGTNDVPTVSAATNSGNEDDAGINGSVSGNDIDGDALTYQLVGEAPEGLTFNPDGTYSFDASSYDSLAQDQVFDVTATFTATDSNGAVSEPQTLTITLTGSNDAPVGTDSSVSVGDGDTVNGSVSASDVDGDVEFYTLTGETPDGLTFNTDGTYSFDASAYSLNLGDEETVTFTFTATDDEGAVSEERTVTITVIGQPTQVTLNDGGDTYIGDNDDEDITGGDGDDVILAGGGTNTVSGGDGDDSITAGSGNDTLNGDGGDDTLTGGSGNDILDGGTGDDNVNGGSGDDLIYSNTGDDILRGGSGNDTISFRNTAAGVTFSMMATGFQVTADGRDLYQGFENAIGSAFNDSITGSDGDNVLEGGDGNDTLTGGLGNDTLIGGAGNDTYFVDAGDTIIEEVGGGIDRIVTYAANFTLGGNIENIYGQSASGHTFTGDDGANTMVGNSGNDVLYGGLGGDTLIGQAGDDILVGGSGVANTLIGGTGNDQYYVDANDTIVELAGQGTDTVLTTRSSFTLGANLENLVFTGMGDFTGTGNVLDNVLTGGAGNDTLKGGAGNDTLDGGDGIDVAQVTGLLSGYSVTREGAGWRVIDTNLGDGDDGSDFLVNMETLRFGNGSTLSLAIMPEPAPLAPVDKAGYAVAQVMPGVLEDDFLVLSKDAGPQVMPGSDDFGDALFGMLTIGAPSFEDSLIARPGHMLELMSTGDEQVQDIGHRHDDWMM